MEWILMLKNYLKTVREIPTIFNVKSMKNSQRDN